MWNSTRKMAEAIADGIRSADSKVTVKLYNASLEDKNDIITEIFKSKAILLGSPTINRGCSYAIAGLMEMVKGMKFMNKKAAAFGSYGWGGDIINQLSDLLKDAGFDLVNDGKKTLWVPDNDEVDTLKEFGSSFVNSLN